MKLYLLTLVTNPINFKILTLLILLISHLSSLETTYIASHYIINLYKLLATRTHSQTKNNSSNKTIQNLARTNNKAECSARLVPSYCKRLHRKWRHPRVEHHPRYDPQRPQRPEVGHVQNLSTVNHRPVCSQLRSL